MVEWKDVVGWADLYEVSDDGRIRNKRTSKLLRLAVSPTGYQYVHLKRRGKRKAARVARLVALAFLEPMPFPRAEVNHKNNDRSCDIVVNLEWVTRAGNTRHAYSEGFGRAPTGQNHGNAKLTEAQVLRILELGSIGARHQNIADEMGVHVHTIRMILWDKAWRHIERD